MKQIFIVERDYNNQREILGAFLDEKSAFKAIAELQRENMESMKFAKIKPRPLFSDVHNFKAFIKMI